MVIKLVIWLVAMPYEEEKRGFFHASNFEAALGRATSSSQHFFFKIPKNSRYFVFTSDSTKEFL